MGGNPFTIAIVVVLVFVSLTFAIGDFAVEPARRAVADMFRVIDLNDCCMFNKCFCVVFTFLFVLFFFFLVFFLNFDNESFFLGIYTHVIILFFQESKQKSL